MRHNRHENYYLQKLGLVIGSLVAITLCIIFAVALGPMLPVAAWIIVALIVFIAVSFTAVLVRLYWIKGTVELINANTITYDDNGNASAKPTRYLKGGVTTLQPGQLKLNVPTHYSVHIANTGLQSGVNQELGLQESVNQSVNQKFTAMEAANLIPVNSLSWCFGKDEEGNPVYSSIADSVHVQNVAGSGAGKTCLTANLLYQLVSRNDKELYTLLIADLKGTLANPFKPFTFMSETRAEGYLKVVKFTRGLLEARMRTSDFTAGLVLVTIEEMLAVKAMLEKEQLEQFAADLKIIATLGREYGVFLLACAQVSYADPLFKEAQAQFITRLGARLKPETARAMGFLDNDLTKRMWLERSQSGRFLLESAGDSRIIRVPSLDMRAGDLTTLLASVNQPVKQRNVKQDYSNVVEANYKVLEEPRSVGKFTTQEINEAYQAYKDGATTYRALQEKLHCSSEKAVTLLRFIKTKYAS